MQKFMQFLGSFPFIARISVQFSQGIHPRHVQGRRPSSPVLCGIVYIRPAPVLPIERIEQPPDLRIRKMHVHIQLEQEHIIRPAIIGVFKEFLGHFFVRRIRGDRSLDKGIPDIRETCLLSRDGIRRPERKQDIHQKRKEYILHRYVIYPLEKTW